MTPAVAYQMSRSASDFVRLVWPAVAEFAGGGELIPVETHSSDEMRRRLDVLAGTDAWQIVGTRGGEVMRPLASRVQWTDRPYKTFTIRYSLARGGETEFQKRLRALREPQSGWLSPALTIHAYVSKDRQRLLWAAMARTNDLIDFADRHQHEDDHRSCWIKPNPQDGNQMLCVNAEALALTAKVAIWPPKRQPGLPGVE